MKPAEYHPKPTLDEEIAALRVEIERLRADLADECHKNEALLGEVGRLKKQLEKL